MMKGGVWGLWVELSAVHFLSCYCASTLNEAWKSDVLSKLSNLCHQSGLLHVLHCSSADSSFPAMSSKMSLPSSFSRPTNLMNNVGSASTPDIIAERRILLILDLVRLGRLQSSLADASTMLLEKSFHENWTRSTVAKAFKSSLLWWRSALLSGLAPLLGSLDEYLLAVSSASCWEVEEVAAPSPAGEGAVGSGDCGCKLNSHDHY